VFVNKGVVLIISFTEWVKNFLNFKPQGVASFTASAALHGFLHRYYSSSTAKCQLPFLGLIITIYVTSQKLFKKICRKLKKMEIFLFFVAKL